MGLGIFLRPAITFCSQLSSYLDKVNTRISEDFEEFFIKKIDFRQFPETDFRFNGHRIHLIEENLHCLLNH